jgi:hypothetical protein
MSVTYPHSPFTPGIHILFDNEIYYEYIDNSSGGQIYIGGIPPVEGIGVIITHWYYGHRVAFTFFTLYCSYYGRTPT